MSYQQLVLNVNLRDGFSFDSFYVKAKTSNDEVLQVLQSFASSLKAEQNVIWGQTQSGKTHLLQACCAQNSQEKHIISYIPIKIAKQHGIEVFSGLSQSQLIAIDDLDEIMGDLEWETALFNLINQTRENNQRLIMSTLENPRKLDCILPDLSSRLIWGGSYQLHALTDEDKPKALQARANQRGFELSDRVIEYLYRRFPRDIESLMKILDLLDKESLRQKTVITVPFVKQVLNKN